MPDNKCPGCGAVHFDRCTRYKFLYDMCVERPDGRQRRFHVWSNDDLMTTAERFKRFMAKEAREGEPMGKLHSAGVVEFETFPLSDGTSLNMMEV